MLGGKCPHMPIYIGMGARGGQYPGDIYPTIMTQRNKQARQKFHCYVPNSHFIQPCECKYVLFVCLFFRLQVSFMPLRFRYFSVEIFYLHS